MRGVSAVARLLGLLLLPAILVQGCDSPPSQSPAPPVPAAAPVPLAYVGGQACADCHPAQAERWKGSDHALAMLPADASAVRGNFDGATFTKDGVTTTFSSRDGRYVARTDGPDGALQDYRVAYTFGVDPLQQYLLELPGGRLQALSIAWDTRPKAGGGQRWYHLYPKEKIDYKDPLHWTGPLQNWNFMCAECHSTNLQKNYRPAEDRFETTWTDVSVNCEACHGPGSRHVQWGEAAKAGKPDPDPARGLVVKLAPTAGAWTLAEGASIAHRAAPLTSRVEVEACGRCHSRRAQVWGEYRHGEPLAQAYRVSLLDPGLYHADGQMQGEVYEYGSFLQSRMYAAGVTCSDCHDPHGGRLRAPGNATCATCHRPATYDVLAHHRHKAETPAAECVACHMPRRVYMGVDGRRDHGFRVPRPDLSVKLGTPNACTDCHATRNARWAAGAVAKWYGPGRRQEWHFGEALHAGRSGAADAEALLVRAFEDAGVPAIARATALSLLARYPGPRALAAVQRGVKDGDPLVRRAAADVLDAAEPGSRIALGLPLLRDPVRTVRLEALGGLLDVPRASLSGEQLAVLEGAIAEYRQIQAFSLDRAEAHANLGMLEMRLGNAAAARAAFETAIRLQPSFGAARIHLADLHRAQGREDRAEATLRAGLAIDPDDGDAREALGLSLVRQKRLKEALPELASAARLRPDVARYAYVHAVALHETGDVRQALRVLTQAHERHPGSREIVVALAEYHAGAGDRDAAIKWARTLVRMSPDDEQARRLLQSLEGKS
jgi:tetratricopeptide (TPR) repeat protein